MCEHRRGGACGEYKLASRPHSCGVYHNRIPRAGAGHQDRAVQSEIGVAGGAEAKKWAAWLSHAAHGSELVCWVVC
jgi:hypothetical protein